MAEKRMFSRKLISSDAFLDLPLTAQGLFFHFCMRADDDGFVDSPKKIMREVKATQRDFNALKDKRYILIFPSGVILIKHWFLHNIIARDRYTPTIYTEEVSTVMLKCGKTYPECTQYDNKAYTERIHSEYKAEPRIEKNSIDKISCPSEDERLIASKDNFEKIYALYPKKSGKAKALEYYMQWHKGRKLSGFDKAIKLTNKQMYLATMKYVAEKKDTETDLQYYKGFDVFMNKAILDYSEEQNE